MLAKSAYGTNLGEFSYGPMAGYPNQQAKNSAGPYNQQAQSQQQNAQPKSQSVNMSAYGGAQSVPNAYATATPYGTGSNAQQNDQRLNQVDWAYSRAPSRPQVNTLTPPGFYNQTQAQGSGGQPVGAPQSTPGNEGYWEKGADGSWQQFTPSQQAIQPVIDYARPPQQTTYGSPQGAYAGMPAQYRPPPFQMAPAQTPWGQSMDPFADQAAMIQQMNQQRMQRQIDFNNNGPKAPPTWGGDPSMQFGQAMQGAGLGYGSPSMDPRYGDSLIGRLNQQFGGQSYYTPPPQWNEPLMEPLMEPHSGVADRYHAAHQWDVQQRYPGGNVDGYLPGQAPPQYDKQNARSTKWQRAMGGNVPEQATRAEAKAAIKSSYAGNAPTGPGQPQPASPPKTAADYQRLRDQANAANRAAWAAPASQAWLNSQTPDNKGFWSLLSPMGG
jgi:hypothetical protein